MELMLVACAKDPWNPSFRAGDHSGRGTHTPVLAALPPGARMAFVTPFISNCHAVHVSRALGPTPGRSLGLQFAAGLAESGSCYGRLAWK